jgi:tetratricopeptide (TPR) repeat protein
MLLVSIVALLWHQTESFLLAGETNDLALAVIRASQGRDPRISICDPTAKLNADKQLELRDLITRLQSRHDSNRWQSIRVANLTQAAMQLALTDYSSEIEGMASSVGPFGRLRLGLVRFTSRDFDDATQIWDLLGAGDYPLGVGNVCRSLRRDDAAEQWYHLGARIDSVKGRALFAMGLLEYSRGNFQKAATQIDEAMKNGYRAAEAYLYAGAALVKLGRHGDAVVILAQGIEGYPQLVDLWLWYAGSTYSMGQINQSLQSYQQALVLDPDNVYGRLGLARIYLRNGDDRATDQIRAVLALSNKAKPDDICSLLSPLFMLLNDNELRDRISQQCD